jgi:hypothetical protein
MFDFAFDEKAVLSELRLDQSDSEVQTNVIDGIYEQLYERMRIRIVDSMSDEDLTEFEKLSEEDANQWLKTHFPDSKEMFEKELEALVDEMKTFTDNSESGAQQLKQEPSE